MINDLDDAIKQLLVKNGGLDSTEIDISFEMPDREWSSSISKPTVNVYLYDIHENRDLRNNDWSITQDGDVFTKRVPPARIDLSYLITIWTNDMADQHRLLGHLLGVLLRYHELPEEILNGSLKGLEWPLRTFTAQSDGVLRNTADFWTALDNQLKPSINYVVTIPVDIDIAVTATEVKTKIFRFGGNGEQPEEQVQISGVIHRKGKPDVVIPGATVLIKELQMTATADEQGTYVFRKLGLGSYTFRISAPGEKQRQIPVKVPSPSYNLDI